MSDFEDIWKLYPNKTGKGKISDSKKKFVSENKDELVRCIDRYNKYVSEQRTNGFKELKYQNGSTFFNSGYVDYLDENYTETETTKQPTKEQLELKRRAELTRQQILGG